MSGDDHNNTTETRTPGPDMRLPGEAFCADCPDHEACMGGYPCDVVQRIANEATARLRGEVGS